MDWKGQNQSDEKEDQEEVKGGTEEKQKKKEEGTKWGVGVSQQVDNVLESFLLFQIEVGMLI